jgi:hypothetical protein
MNPKNPYFILELDPDASPLEIERQGKKLLALLEVGAAKGRSYESPFGSFDRDATMVREAVAALRDARRRERERCLFLLVGAHGSKSGGAERDAPLADPFLEAGFAGL